MQLGSFEDYVELEIYKWIYYNNIVDEQCIFGQAGEDGGMYTNKSAKKIKGRSDK